ncbi:hypothetical protein BpHYR1_014704 [Brachionus plicatilis]|uniref:Uncharacterized protein n=1 Tax=Brachionus plicatilis TaxID=10195 RepID=A0A3M7RFG5_BRAPC|nr:hypothetical protein BpHYR1_014704 [Brachionus plicatilis]
MEKINDFKNTKPKLYLAMLIFSVVILILMTIFPISMIVIGATNMDKCPIEPKIPIWLIVAGSVSIVLALISFITLAVPSLKVKLVLTVVFGILGGLLGMFQFAWFITGNVWVYSKHRTVVYDDPDSGLYCDKTLFLFTFWTITASYIMMGVSFIISIIAACCSCLCSICFFSRS